MDKGGGRCRGACSVHAWVPISCVDDVMREGRGESDLHATRARPGPEVMGMGVDELLCHFFVRGTARMMVDGVGLYTRWGKRWVMS